MSANGFCPCGNSGILVEDCPLCGKPFSWDVDTITPESSERSTDDHRDHKDADIEECVANFNLVYFPLLNH